MSYISRQGLTGKSHSQKFLLTKTVLTETIVVPFGQKFQQFFWYLNNSVCVANSDIVGLSSLIETEPNKVFQCLSSILANFDSLVSGPRAHKPH